MESQVNVHQRMDQHVLGWRERGDSRHIFLSCYRLMTENMLGAIEKDSFRDRQWVEKLLHGFADYYFNALACFDCKENVPLVWHHVHHQTMQNKLHKLQYLMIGVNAHINYDLVLALHDMLQPEWSKLSAEEQKIRYEDHCMVNRIIAGTIDRVQDEILEPSDPVLAWIDRVFGRLDEYLLSRLITNWRHDVWENTQRMLEADNSPKKETVRQMIEYDVIRRGKLISIDIL